MPIQINVELDYEVLQRSTVLFCLHPLRTDRQELDHEQFQVTPPIEWDELPLGSGGNRYVRLDTDASSRLQVTYGGLVRIQPRLVLHGEIDRIPVSAIPRAAIPYLFPSRYCESDRLGRLARHGFGHIDHPYDQAVAISDWIYESIDYLYGETSTATSAFDTVTQRAGVCRDFAHLGIALCRALSIPARYVSAYAVYMEPPDFHACFEAYIGDRWFIFDPTRLAALNGLVRIATGRDAADTAVATIFGSMNLLGMSVSCVADDFVPLGAQDLAERAVSLD